MDSASKNKAKTWTDKDLETSHKADTDLESNRRYFGGLLGFVVFVVLCIIVIQSLYNISTKSAEDFLLIGILVSVVGGVFNAVFGENLLQAYGEGWVIGFLGVPGMLMALVSAPFQHRY